MSRTLVSSGQVRRDSGRKLLQRLPTKEGTLLTLDTKVDAVTVFRSGAQVVRVAELKVGPEGWPSQVRLAGLPLAVNDASVRVAASFPQGGAGVLVADTRVDLDLAEAPTPTPPSTDLEALRWRRWRLKAELELLREDLQRTATLEPPPRPQVPAGQAPVEFHLESRRSLVELRQARLELLSERNRRLNEELSDVDGQILDAEVLLRSAQAAPSADRLRKVVVVGLRVRSGAQPPLIRLEVSYQVEGARWAPSYTLRFDRDVTMADLSLRAMVCQSSGEDWQGVQLSLSTADPSAWKDLPELASRRIGRAQPVSKKTGWRPAPPGTEALFADFDRGPSRPREESPVAMVEVAQPVGDPFAGAIDPFGAGSGADPFASVGTFDPFAASQDPFAAAPAADPFASEAECLDFAGAPPPATSAHLSRPSEEAGEVCRAAFFSKAKKVSEPRAGLQRIASDKPSLPQPAPVVMAQAVRPGSVVAKSRALPQRARAELARWVEPSSDSLEMGEELLAYGLLRMPAGDERGRGKLQRQSAVAACLRLLPGRHTSLGFDPQAVVQAALEQARRALHRQPPGSHRCPGAVRGFDYLYPGESRVDLPSDCQFHSLPVLQRQLPAQLLWVTVPRVSTDVFRQAEVESLPDLALPGGPVDVFVGRDFLLTTNLDDLVPGGKVPLGLGVEQGLKVVRNTSFKESTAGMMGGTLQLRHTIEIELANRLAREVRLEVRECVPQADDEEVKLKVEPAEPPWEVLEGTLAGAYRWSLRLAAGAKTVLKAAYLVELSSKLELAGGNRREE